MANYFTTQDLKDYEPRFTQGVDDTTLDMYLTRAEAWAEARYAERGLDTIPTACQTSPLFKQAVMRYAATLLLLERFIGEIPTDDIQFLLRLAENQLQDAISACLRDIDTTADTETGSPNIYVEDISEDDERWP